MTAAFPETCSYVAGYVQKKLYGKDKDFFRLPEFMRCSQHLGERWLYDHIDQFDDEHPFINWHGYKYGIPRQFRKILVKEGRLKQSSLHSAALTQKKEYLKLAEHVSQQGFTMAEFSMLAFRTLSRRISEKRIDETLQETFRNEKSDTLLSC